MPRFKLRFYKVSGFDKGNLDHEEFFETYEEMDKRSNEVFAYNRFSYNPTAWDTVEGEWKRLEGY